MNGRDPRFFLRRALAASCALGLAWLGLPRGAQAYCVKPPSERWTPPPGPIPVYVSGGLIDGIEGIGLGGPGQGDEIAWVKAAIAIVNEASTDAPRLYYAGINYNAQVGLNFWPSRSEGITVSVYPCNQTPSGRFAVATTSGQKAAIRFRMGRGGGCGNGLWWVDPADEATPGVSWSLDFVSVLVHEFVHLLGLDHTNVTNPQSATVCDQSFSPLATRNSVMNTGDKFFRRRLRRDDVEGLRALWGEPERRPWWSTSTAKNPAPLTWTVPAGFSPNLRVNTPVTLTSSSRDNDGTITMGFTDHNDVVRYLNGTWWGWYGGTGAAVRTPGGDPIVSYDRVVVSRGRDFDLFATGTYGARRLLVAWHGTDETACCGPERVTDFNGNEPNVVHTRVWWRVHNGSAWQPPRYTSTTRYKELGAGYDPLSDMFVLVGVDTCRPSGGSCQAVADAPRDQTLFVRTIRGSDGSWACTQALTTAGHVLAVGDVSCDFRGFTFPASPTRCVIPVTTTDEVGGPRLRFIEGEIRSVWGYTCFVRTVDPPTTLDVLATGTPSTALDGYHPPSAGSWLLGAFAPQFSGAPGASGWSRVYTLGRDASTGYVVPPEGNVRTFDSEYWPLSVGSLTRTFVPYVKWEVVGY